MLAACQDPLIQRWTTVPAPYTQADAVGWVERIAPEGWETGAAATFAVLDALSAEVLASVGLSGLKHGPEVGYWCARRGGTRSGSSRMRSGSVPLGLPGPWA